MRETTTRRGTRGSSITNSKTGLILSAHAGFGASLLTILGLLLLLGGQSVHAATGTTDPVAGLINQVAIDMDPTGNSPGTGTTGTTVTLLGPVDTVASNVPLNSVHNVDIIVDEVAPADGNAFAFGFNLLYDRNIVSINGHNENFMVAPGGFEPGIVPDPDTSGNWRVDFITLGAGLHTGEGALVRVGIMCGNTIGSSTLTIDDSTNGSSLPEVFTHNNTNGDPTVPMPVNHVGSATIFCGEGATSSPTASPTPTVTPSPRTASPVPTASQAPTATPTLTTSPKPSASAPSTPSIASTPSPRGLPNTGGTPSHGNGFSWMLLLVAVFVCSLGAAVAGLGLRRREIEH